MKRHVHMEEAILSMVSLMLCWSLLDARQNLRFSPSNFLVPVGILLVEQRLWYNKLLGCCERELDVFLSATLKFDCSDHLGFAVGPY